MKRQHATPVLISADGNAVEALVAMPLGTDGHGVNEAAIQLLIQRHPACLPISEVDPLFVDPVPICTELNTPAGPIDNFMVTATGLPVLVECKLWRNPEGRREVVGQILDYAKELSRWTSSDLQREVSRRLKREGNALLEIVRAAGHDVDEIVFNDALTLNLRRGRFLLLIVGDGIRQGVESIAEYLQGHSGLHFTLGLVELPIFEASDGSRLVVPRVVARTELLTHTVVAMPDGMQLADQAADDLSRENDPDGAAWSTERQQFWSDFQSNLVLDDPEQQVGRPPKLGYMSLMMPVPRGASWLTIYRDVTRKEVGIFLSYHYDGVGERISDCLADDPLVLSELGDGAHIVLNKGRKRIIDSIAVPDIASVAGREQAFIWLRRRANEFVNVLRPRIKSLARDFSDETQ